MKDITFNGRFSQFMVRREMSKTKRIASMKIRLVVNMGGYSAPYEELK